MSRCDLVLLYFGIYFSCHSLLFLICRLISNFFGGGKKNSQQLPLQIYLRLHSLSSLSGIIITDTLSYLTLLCRLWMLSYVYYSFCLLFLSLWIIYVVVSSTSVCISLSCARSDDKFVKLTLLL